LQILEEEGRRGVNSRLSVEMVGSAPSLIIRDPRMPRLPPCPVIVLDSTGDPKLYEQVLGRKVRVFDPKVKVKAKVVQVASGAYGRQSLRLPATRNRLFDAVKAIVDAHPKSKIGVVTFKDRVIELAKHLGEPERVAFAHFWGLRGTNALQDCQHLIVVGTPTSNIGELVAEVQALHWDDDAIDTTSIERWERLGRLDETEDVEVPVRHYLDDRLDRWLWQHRQAELLQAAFRLRPLDGHRRKTLWLLTNVPIKGIEPTKVHASVEELVASIDG